LVLDIYCWNVGRGEATVLAFPTANRVHIVDFGTMSQGLEISREHIVRGVSEANNILEGYGSISAVVTHLHYDHYSLIPLVIGSRMLDELYLPIIPEPPDIRRMVIELLVLQRIVLEKSGIVRGELAQKAKRVYLVGRGVSIEVDASRKLYAKVLWPPPYLSAELAEKVREKLKPLYDEFKDVAKRVVGEWVDIEVEVRRRANELLEYLESRARFRGKQELESVEPIEAEVSLPLPVYSSTSEIGGETEASRLAPQIEHLIERFRDAVNDLSLVLKYYHRYGFKDVRVLALIPGDNSQEVLNHLYQLEIQELKSEPWLRFVVFLRGAHHGIYFGRYLEEHRALCTWLSWTERLEQELHSGYLHIANIIGIAQYTRKLSLKIRNHHRHAHVYVRMYPTSGTSPIYIDVCP